jgi:hypothetical protein
MNHPLDAVDEEQENDSELEIEAAQEVEVLEKQATLFGRTASLVASKAKSMIRLAERKRSTGSKS